MMQFKVFRKIESIEKYIANQKLQSFYFVKSKSSFFGLTKMSVCIYELDDVYRLIEAKLDFIVHDTMTFNVCSWQSKIIDKDIVIEFKQNCECSDADFRHWVAFYKAIGVLLGAIVNKSFPNVFHCSIELIRKIAVKVPVIVDEKKEPAAVIARLLKKGNAVKNSDQANRNDAEHKIIADFKKKLAYVQKTHETMELEPMDKNIRRRIHNISHHYANIKSTSVGNGANRHVVISYVVNSKK